MSVRNTDHPKNDQRQESWTTEHHIQRHHPPLPNQRINLDSSFTSTGGLFFTATLISAPGFVWQYTATRGTATVSRSSHRACRVAQRAPKNQAIRRGASWREKGSDSVRHGIIVYSRGSSSLFCSDDKSRWFRANSKELIQSDWQTRQYNYTY